jgi:hypothetical protein
MNHAALTPKPYILSWVSTWDAGKQLVLQTFAGKGSLPSEAALAFDFRPRHWYHVVVAHAPGGPLSAPLASLYVDGQPVAAAEKLRYPKARPARVAIPEAHGNSTGGARHAGWTGTVLPGR